MRRPGGNLRHFRSIRQDVDALAKLQANAEQHVVALYERHGWELPPLNPRIQPLD